MPSAKANIRAAFLYQVGLINTGNGYQQSYKIAERQISPEKMLEFPAVDAFWGREDIQNQPQSAADYNIQIKKKVTLYLDIWCYSVNDLDSEREKALWDFERFFGLKYNLPDSGGNPTCVESWLLWNEPFGWQTNTPYGGLTMAIGVHYRQGFTDPSALIL